MKFGIFYELQLPKPWDPTSERDLYRNALAQLELADRLGYDYAWEVEHHFLEEYSHSPAPEVFLGAASQRTSRIRLGHGIIQLTTNHPARVAERVAALDLLSDGRVEFGIGEGASITELGPFDRGMAEKRAVWEDAVRCILPMMQQEGFEYDGPYFQFPLRNVLPKPLQRPHPPLWVACSQLETIEMAGRRGMGALGFQFLSAEAAHAWVHAYYNSFVKWLDKLADYATNPNIALVSYFMCAETDEEARRRADGVTFFHRAALLQRRPGPRAGEARHRQPLGRIRGLEAGQPGSGGARPVRRADRLARDAQAQAAEVRKLEHRPDHPAEPGRQEQPCRHLRKPGAVCPRGDAGIPRARAGAPGVEARRAGRRDRAGGDRHRALPRPLRAECGAGRPAGGGGVIPMRWLFLTLALLLPGAARAADPAWPTRPLVMVVAYPPGAITDTVGRRVAERLGAALGQNVVIENRGGAGGNIAAAHVARQRGDDHTLLFTSYGNLIIAAAADLRLEFHPSATWRRWRWSGR
ncbi:LLM class flavin-dependent oxidoreductase [Siccirubricoccus deserti]